MFIHNFIQVYNIDVFIIIFVAIGVCCHWCMLPLVYVAIGVCCHLCMFKPLVYVAIGVCCHWCMLPLVYVSSRNAV